MSMFNKANSFLQHSYLLQLVFIFQLARKMVNYSSAFTDRFSCTKHFIKKKKNNMEFIEQSTRLNIYIEAISHR